MALNAPLHGGIGNAANWRSLWSQAYFASKNAQGKHIPIIEQRIPVTVGSSIIVATTSSSTAKPHWTWGGTLIQGIRTGILVGGGADTEANRRRVWLNKLTLIQFEKLASAYTLAFRPARWHQDIKLSVWEYQGVFSNATENLIQLVRQDLARIQQAITHP